MMNHDTEGTMNMDTIIEQNQTEQYGTERLCEGQPVCLIVFRHLAHYLTPEQRDRREQDDIEVMVSSVPQAMSSCDHVTTSANFRRAAHHCSRTAKWTVTVHRITTTVRSPRCSWHKGDGTNATIIGTEAS